MNNQMKIMLGCDPEAFLATVQGELRSSIGRVGGSKVAPMPLPLGPGYAVQEDNVALEFNIPPAGDKQAFIDSIQNTLKFLGDAMHEHHGLMIVNTSAESFPDSELQDPAALMFGCDPDFNAWTNARNPKPKAADKNLRSCGGHIHVGYNTRDETLAPGIGRTIIKNMDLHLGVPSVLMDKGEKRKELYGASGAYREKIYGVEYRTLSNFWIFSKELIGWAYDNTLRAVNAAVVQPVLQEEDHLTVQNCINKNDKFMAEFLVHKYNLGMA